VLDGDTIDRIQRRDLAELSVGYYARLDDAPGTTPEGETYDAIQREIRGNHLALLPAGQARGGRSVRLLLDAAGDECDQEELMAVQIRLDGQTFEVEAVDDAVAKAADAVQARLDAAADVIATLEAERDAARSALADATSTERLDALVTERAALLEAARLVAGEGFEPTGDANQIRRDALVKAGVALDGRSDEYVTARFDVAADVARERAATAKVADARKVTDPAPRRGGGWSIDAAARAARGV
jgi:hypothetical protein